jgi:hypothetical protein
MKTITFRGSVVGFVANEYAEIVRVAFVEKVMVDGVMQEIHAVAKDTESAYGQTTIEKQAFSVQLKLNYAGCVPEQILFMLNRGGKTDLMNSLRINPGDSEGTVKAKRTKQAKLLAENKANGFVLFDCSAIGKDGKVSEKGLEILDKKVTSVAKNINSLTKEQRAELLRALQEADAVE